MPEQQESIFNSASILLSIIGIFATLIVVFKSTSGKQKLIGRRYWQFIIILLLVVLVLGLVAVVVAPAPRGSSQKPGFLRLPPFPTLAVLLTPSVNLKSNLNIKISFLGLVASSVTA